MDSFHNIIYNQISLNKGMNFFHKGNSLEFTPGLLDTISDNKIKGEIVGSLADYTVSNVLAEFYRVNQYYNFREQEKRDLRLIYIDLYNLIRQNRYTKETLAEMHSENLKKWLLSANPFSEKMYSTKGEKLEVITCYEYSPELQLSVLQIELSNLTEPVLDIGCGENGNLVGFLRQRGIEAFGVDRYPSCYDFIEDSDWLLYDYGSDKWGTIISNLGFSNHFLHHHLRTDGDYISYAKTYMQILNSLKVGGRFHYAPSLPFIESYLNTNQYRVNQIELETLNAKGTIIERLK